MSAGTRTGSWALRSPLFSELFLTVLYYLNSVKFTDLNAPKRFHGATPGLYYYFFQGESIYCLTVAICAFEFKV